jgi:hypothetical protein
MSINIRFTNKRVIKLKHNHINLYENLYNKLEIKTNGLNLVKETNKTNGDYLMRKITILYIVLILLSIFIISCAFFPSDEGDAGDSGDAGQLEPPEVWGTTPSGDPTPTWYWSSVEGAVIYRYKFADEISWSTTPSLQYTPVDALDVGEHTLYVQAGQIVNGNYTNWSTSGSFTIKVVSEL